MHKRAVAVLALAVLVGLPALGPAQQKEIPKVRINTNGVRLGFPMLPQQGGPAHGFKIGAWTPIYVDLVAGKGKVFPPDAVVTVSAEDNGDMQTLYRANVPTMDTDEQLTMVTYGRTAKSTGDIIVTLTLADGRVVSNEKVMPAAFSPAAFFYLQAGVRDNGMRTALHVRNPQPGQPLPKEEDDLSRDDAHCFAYASSVAELPTRWYGYGSADVVLLHTGRDDKFVQELLDDRTNRKEALVEWVRRGGRIVVSVGRNHQLTGKLLEAMKLIDCQINGQTPRAQMTATMQWCGEAQWPFPPAKDPPSPVEVAKIEKIGPSVDVLLTEPPDAQDQVARPVILQSGCGLGRVVLIAFDLEVGPHRVWLGRPKLWGKLQTLLEAPQARSGTPDNMPGAYPGMNVNSNELASRMYGKLDHFEEVPVVSFGWVALFILIYIIVVGPLDYLFLTKVVKRPELTWVTFPAVVIAISAIAYFTAYWIKGRDLRINKLDVVDIVAELDADGEKSRGAMVSGTTWFTLFSPRIQNYTVGVEPAAGPGLWAPRPDANPTSRKDPYSTVVTWFARTDDSFNGTGGGSAPSLFRRAYEYAPDAAGLEGVPIQVWTTKSFQATWQEALTPEMPLVTADLSHPPAAKPTEERPLLSGRIDSFLPVTLKDVTLFYRGQYYSLGDLPPGPTRLDAVLKQHQDVKQWYQDVQQQLNNPGYNYNYGGKSSQTWQPPWSLLVKPLWFHDKFDQNPIRTSLMRNLDEGWRLDRPEEVILVGRAAPQAAPESLTTAETVTADALSPTRLWLGQLPQSGGTRPGLDGKMNQETYVRIILPVKPAKKPAVENPNP